MTGFRFKQDPRANETFGLAVLQAISSAEGLDVLRRTLVLKGGAALLHVYGSGRATRTDLDFDVGTDEQITEDPILRLMAHLRDPWRAAYSTGSRQGGFEVFDDAVNAGPISYRHAHGSPEGAIILQISRRKVPPYMAEFIEDHPLVGPDGRSFVFPIMPLEVIAAEKAFRSVSTKGPHITDQYDIGYILEHVAFRGPIAETYRLICSDERRRIARDRNDRALREMVDVARRCRSVEDLFRDERVIDAEVTFANAQRRVLDGIAYARHLAGLAPIKGVAVPGAG